jgi:hypothetical protein
MVWISQDNVGQGDSEDEEASQGTARKGSYPLLFVL